MSCGMVRKVDELGRVVIPKEMRRILNIKTGSSIEMFINDNNEVVLKKFSEITNVLLFAENLAEVIFYYLNLPCLISDDEKILVVKGVNKKEYLNKKIVNLNNKNNNQKDYFILNKEEQFLLENKNNFENNYIFNIYSEGIETGYIYILSENILPDNKISNIIILKKFLSNLLKF